MARRKKKGNLSADLSVPDCFKPLVDNKAVSTYIITRCIEGTSNKLYIFIIATYKKKPYLARFWGPFNGQMYGIHEEYDKDALQKLINEKALKGYRIVDNVEITESSDVYGKIAQSISNYIDELPSLVIGHKTLLT